MNINRLNIIIIYVVLIAFIMIYLFLYLDSQFKLVDKFLFSRKPKIELCSFKEIEDNFNYINSTKSKLIETNNELLLGVAGFPHILLNEDNRELFHRNKLHPTQILSLYSMIYLTDYFVVNYDNKTLSSSSIDNIERVYMVLSKEILNYLSINTMVTNDHVISERIQFLSLMIPYIKEFYPEKNDFIKNMQIDFNICLGFLMNDKHFTWKTNHGLMQIRALGKVSEVIKSGHLRDKLLYIFDKRLLDVLHYFIGEDGAIYESATEYWSFILGQFREFLYINSVRDRNTLIELQSMLNKSETFLNYVSSNDGYMQGLGDSYSYVLRPEYKTEVNSNRLFRFSNNLAGINYTSDSINVNILFSSLFTPPNVHKLPEDLSLWLYINQPLFTNTGTYSYNNSIERKHFVEHETAHSTVYFKDEPNSTLDSSNVYVSHVSDSLIIFVGNKFYPDEQIVTRNVAIRNNSLEICDFSNQKKEIISQFNLSNNINYKLLSDKELAFITDDSISITLKSNLQINLYDNAIISEKPQELTIIDQLRISGDSIKININIPNINVGFDSFTSIISDYDSSHRQQISNKLEVEYKSLPNTTFKNGLLIRFFFSALFFILFVIISELVFYRFKKKVAITYINNQQ